MSGAIPAWTEGDRLAKALRVAGITQKEMARLLGVDRNTITNYVRGHTRIKRGTRTLWASRTGVDEHWLETGHPGVDVP